MGARNRPQQGGLADPVTPHHAGDRANLHRDGDLPQRDRGAVMQIDFFDYQHQAMIPSDCSELCLRTIRSSAPDTLR